MKLICVAVIMMLLSAANADRVAIKQTLLRASALNKASFSSCQAALNLFKIETEWGLCDEARAGQIIVSCSAFETARTTTRVTHIIGNKKNKGQICKFVVRELKFPDFFLYVIFLPVQSA